MSGASWLASRLTSNAADKGPAGNAVFNAALIGLLAARLAHLGLNADLYTASPWSAFDVRDGGWYLPAGVLAGVAWLAWRGLRLPRLRRSLALAGLAGMLVGVAASAATRLGHPKAMPDLALIQLDGAAQTHLSQAARGRPVVVNLWASWCGPCRQEMPHLNRLYDKYRSGGFTLLAVNIDDDPRTAVATAAKMGLRFPVLLDTDKAVSKRYDLGSMPATVLIDRDGKVRYLHRGYREGMEVSYEQQIRELVKE